METHSAEIWAGDNETTGGQGERQAKKVHRHLLVCGGRLEKTLPNISFKKI
jgi:hypothetical protein